MTGDDLCFLSGGEAARLIAARQLSPVELVDAILARVEAVQPHINAFTVVRAEAARAEAKAAEAAVGNGDALGLLHGVPFTVKDMIDVAGERITWGSYMFENNVPAEDAPVVARLKAAGGIVLGITNMPECGPKGVTDNPLWGTTRNPWNLEHTPGGSSGGAGAALASGCGALAIGTDRAGSVRIPASCCGVVGLKTTAGAWPNTDVLDFFDKANVIGPLTRTVSDGALMMSVVTGPDERDPLSLGTRRRDFGAAADARGDMKGMRVAWTSKVGNTEVDHDTLAQCEAAVEALGGLGAEVEEIDLDLLASVHILFVLVGARLHAAYGDKLEEFGERLDPALRQAIEDGARWTGADVFEAAFARVKLFEDIEALFSGFDLVATPTLTMPTIPIDQFSWDPVTVNGKVLRSPRYDWLPYSHPFNHTGHPAISVPAGWTSEELPVGLQLVAPWHAEERLLGAAAELEAVRPWAHRRPPLLENLAAA